MLVRWAKRCLQSSCTAQSGGWFLVWWRAAESPASFRLSNTKPLQWLPPLPQSMTEVPGNFTFPISKSSSSYGLLNCMLIWELLVWAQACEKSSMPEPETFLWSYDLSSLFLYAFLFIFHCCCILVLPCSNRCKLICGPSKFFFPNKEESVGISRRRKSVK